MKSIDLTCHLSFRRAEPASSWGCSDVDGGSLLHPASEFYFFSAVVLHWESPEGRAMSSQDQTGKISACVRDPLCPSS